MTALRNLLFKLIFYPTSAVIALVVVAGSFSTGFLRFGSRVWAGWFILCARVLLGIRLVVRGEVPRSGLVAVKHQSMYETIAILWLLPAPAVIMKQELRQIPLWGWIAERHGSVFIERKAGGRALKQMLRAARSRKEAGRPIVIFPEGTRVPVGSAPPLKAGIVALYQGLKLPVVPVALDAGRLWAKGGNKKSGTITISFLPEIEPGLPRNEVEERIQQAINLDPVEAPICAG